MCVSSSFLTVMLMLWAMIFSPAQLAAKDKKPHWPAHVRFLTGPTGGSWHTMGDSIAGALSHDVLPTTSRIGGGLNNLLAVSDKRGDLAFSLNCLMNTKDTGDSAFGNANTDNIVLIATIYPQIVYFLISASFAEQHGIVDVETLLQSQTKVRLASLRPGTASNFILKLLLKHGYNTSYEQLVQRGWSIGFYNYADAADKLADDTIDCFAFTAGVNMPLINTVEEYMAVRILPINAHALHNLTQKIKTTQFVIQPGTYKCVTEPILTLGDHTNIVARKDLPDDLAYNIAESLWRNKQHIAASIQDFSLLTASTVMPEGLPVHPGAARFWKHLQMQNVQ